MVYIYDGSFDGLMCCVFESCEMREIPSEILAGIPEQLSFGDVREIVTDEEKSRRVISAVKKKISAGALEFIRKMFLSCDEQKDKTILLFLLKGFRVGRSIEYMLSDDTVYRLNKAVHHLEHEAHLLMGFVRFSDFSGYLAAVIEPKNKVLPLLAGHFTDRFPNEDFLIYDKAHHMALIYYNGRPEIAEEITFELPAAASEELHFRRLWKCFYDTIAIKERENPRCRMSLMPKRFWANLTEMTDIDEQAPPHSAAAITALSEKALPRYP